jgi:mono/diheme cytochrome c family protein
MSRNLITAFVTFGSILMLAEVLGGQQIGDTPAITTHLDERDIESGRIPFPEVIKHGRRLFTAAFNKLDGQGPSMAHVKGPDAHSCISCHNRPRPGGGGDFPTNVFVNGDGERMTVSLFGAGPIEMLAREMTRELQATRMAAINQAFLSARNVPAHLAAKGIDFGDIVAHPDGTVDASGVRGVSGDLVIRPFHQAGGAVSLRQFTNEGMNQHLGLQSQELVGIDTDPDGDGVSNEITVGDMTAIALFQAQLPTPARVIPEDPVKRKAAGDGEALFSSIGCASCHVPTMKLNDAMFTEANPFNPEWTLPVTVSKPVGFDMTKVGEAPRLEPISDGGALIHAYTDLKRHNLCDGQERFYCAHDKEEFLTRKLWDIGSSAAFGHRGDLSTIGEAIEHHAGEARPSREKYSKLSAYERAAIVEFLKTLQIGP